MLEIEDACPKCGITTSEIKKKHLSVCSNEDVHQYWTCECGSSYANHVTECAKCVALQYSYNPTNNVRGLNV